MKIFRIARLFVIAALLLQVQTTFARRRRPKRFHHYKQVARTLRKRDFRRAFSTLDVTVARSLGQPDLVMGEFLPAAAAMADAAARTTEAGTNVQTAGVGEGDIVKTDGTFLYILTQSHLAVVRAAQAPADDKTQALELLSFTPLAEEHFLPSELYLYGDMIAVVGPIYDFRSVLAPVPRDAEASEAKHGKVWRPAVRPARVGIRLFDVSDPEHVERVRRIEVEGSLISTRRIDERLLIVARAYPALDAIAETSRKSAGTGLVPQVADSLDDAGFRDIDAHDIACFPDCFEAAYLVVAELDMSRPDGAFTSQAFLGVGHVVYASRSNLYVASTPWFWRPVILADRHARRSPPPDHSLLFRFAITDDGVKFAARGRVPGRVANSFCMDERDGILRVVTTSHPDVWADGVETSGVYTFDENLEPLGQVTGIAPGERLYASRFLGDKGYLITFERIDPLFVVDLSDPAAPAILGELEVPGYSSYLHPLDDSHIIGIGKAVDMVVTPWSGPDGTPIEQGLQLSLFDVEDATAPELQFSETLGGRGSHSEALWNHHAFLYDPAQALLAFPCSLRTVAPRPGLPPWRWTDFVFQGALVFDVDPDDGFVESGRITHMPEGPDGLWDAPRRYAVRRIVLVNNVLHTISEGMVQAHAAGSLERLGVLELPWVEPPRYDGPVLHALTRAEPSTDELIGMGATPEEVAGDGGLLEVDMTPAENFGMLLREAIEAKR